MWISSYTYHSSVGTTLEIRPLGLESRLSSTSGHCPCRRPVQFLAPASGGSQLPVAPSLGDLMASSVFHRHCAHMHIQTPIQTEKSYFQ